MFVIGVHRCPQTVLLWNSKFAAFCNGDRHRVPNNAVSSVIAKIMELMASLMKDTVTKARSSSRWQKEAIVEAGVDFFCCFEHVHTDVKTADWAR